MSEVIQGLLPVSAICTRYLFPSRFFPETGLFCFPVHNFFLPDL
jgi:hypothetical protein